MVELLVPPGNGAAVTVLSDGRIAASAAGTALPFPELRARGAAAAAALSPDGKLLAVGGTGFVTVYDLSSGEELLTSHIVRARSASLAFGHDGRSIVIGGADGTVYRYRFGERGEARTISEQERLFEQYLGHSSVVSAVAVHPFGEVLFSADWHGALFAWQRYDADPYRGKYDRNVFEGPFFSEAPKRLRAGRPGGSPIDHAEISADGRFLYLALGNGWIEAWKVRGFVKVAELQAHHGAIYDLIVSPDGLGAVTAGRDGSVKRWKLNSSLAPEVNREIFAIELTGEAKSAARELAFGGSGGVLGAENTGKVEAIEFTTPPAV